MIAVHRQFLRIRNSSCNPLKLYLEPWGDEILMAVGASYEISSEGPADGFIEVDTAGDRLTVYGWPGSTLSVREHGKLVCDCTVPVPHTPAKN